MTIDIPLPASTAGSSQSPASPGDAGPQPSLAQAARCLHKNNRPFEDGRSIDDLTYALAVAQANPEDSENMMFEQAHLLDAMFRRIVFHDMHSRPRDPEAIPYLLDDKLDYALRTQRLCRVTVELMEELKNKKSRKQTKGDVKSQ